MLNTLMMCRSSNGRVSSQQCFQGMTVVDVRCLICHGKTYWRRGEPEVLLLLQYCTAAQVDQGAPALLQYVHLTTRPNCNVYVFCLQDRSMTLSECTTGCLEHRTQHGPQPCVIAVKFKV